jgi:imidazolonepropionase-like amidohydrolase
MTSIFYNEGEIRSQLGSTKFALKQMYDAGVPVVMGSDAGCWPVIPFMFHGVSSIREMEVMVESGMPVIEVIRAATGNAARMIGIDGRVGSVAVGKVADLVIYDVDPTIDIKAFRKPAYVMKSGVLRTPAEWLAEEMTL